MGRGKFPSRNGRSRVEASSANSKFSTLQSITEENERSDPALEVSSLQATKVEDEASDFESELSALCDKLTINKTKYGSGPLLSEESSDWVSQRVSIYLSTIEKELEVASRYHRSSMNEHKDVETPSDNLTEFSKQSGCRIPSAKSMFEALEAEIGTTSVVDLRVSTCIC
jgi:hypothetical protein